MIYLLPTKFSSNLFRDKKYKDSYYTSFESFKRNNFDNQFMYITSDDVDIMDNDFIYDTVDNIVYKVFISNINWIKNDIHKKVISTNDPKLISFGVKEIDFEFLLSFVNNNNYEFYQYENKGKVLVEDYKTYNLAIDLFTEIYGYSPQIIEGNIQHELIVGALQKGIVFGFNYKF